VRRVSQKSGAKRAIPGNAEHAVTDKHAAAVPPHLRREETRWLGATVIYGVGDAVRRGGGVGAVEGGGRRGGEAAVG